jgi:hypothetical protein
VAEISRPTTYVGRLQFAQRLVRTAQFRSDAKLAVRELCEAINEITNALLERETGQAATASTENPPK